MRRAWAALVIAVTTAAPALADAPAAVVEGRGSLHLPQPGLFTDVMTPDSSTYTALGHGSVPLAMTAAGRLYVGGPIYVGAELSAGGAVVGSYGASGTSSRSRGGGRQPDLLGGGASIGARVLAGPLDVRIELYVGALASATLHLGSATDPTHGGTLGTSTGYSATAVVAPRLAVDWWFASRVTLGVYVGVDLLGPIGDVDVGIGVAYHTDARDVPAHADPPPAAAPEAPTVPTESQSVGGGQW